MLIISCLELRTTISNGLLQCNTLVLTGQCFAKVVLYAKLTCELIDVDVSNELECEVGFSLDEGFVVIKVV